ncbi:MAG: hypothetical protein K6T63_09805 [Alicyclobacillus herbarius]|uniref:hypothetical protein n=1 Tax=Alicyclobacillus herbarius TaxID=122960 RepID=UPI0023523CB8|nr:hypothetical protein [Alicyclobacillus herbarius]MCL6632916.1 hypothetical protein [Alicyclobacillus herbarius]
MQPIKAWAEQLLSLLTISSWREVYAQVLDLDGLPLGKRLAARAERTASTRRCCGNSRHVDGHDGCIGGDVEPAFRVPSAPTSSSSGPGVGMYQYIMSQLTVLFLLIFGGLAIWYFMRHQHTKLVSLVVIALHLKRTLTVFGLAFAGTWASTKLDAMGKPLPVFLLNLAAHTARTVGSRWRVPGNRMGAHPLLVASGGAVPKYISTCGTAPLFKPFPS